MTCKDCVHCEVCRNGFGENIFEETRRGQCKHFKSKSDAVEVVRCKDCIHFSNDTDYCRKHNKGYCELDNVIKPPTYYCSYGERKDD